MEQIGVKYYKGFRMYHMTENTLALFHSFKTKIFQFYLLKINRLWLGAAMDLESCFFQEKQTFYIMCKPPT